jgi:hypothetical protein
VSVGTRATWVKKERKKERNMGEGREGEEKPKKDKSSEGIVWVGKRKIADRRATYQAIGVSGCPKRGTRKWNVRTRI